MRRTSAWGVALRQVSEVRDRVRECVCLAVAFEHLELTTGSGNDIDGGRASCTSTPDQLCWASPQHFHGP